MGCEISSRHDFRFMTLKISLALGIGLGRAVYETMRFGFHNIDWTGAVFVAAVSFVLLLPFPIQRRAKP